MTHKHTTTTTVKTVCARFSALSDGLVRLEFDPRGQFEDRLSVRAATRGTAASFASQARLEDGMWVLATPRLEIRYREDGQPFHRGNLSVTCPKTGQTIWTPGQVDPQNLGGAHTSMDVVQRGMIAEGVHPATDAYHDNDWRACLWWYKGWGITADNYDASGSLEQVLAANDLADLPAEIQALVRERRKYPPGLLSRAGYFLYNDSEQAVIDPETHWIVPRNAAEGNHAIPPGVATAARWMAPKNAPGDSLDLYLFVYGNDFKAALADLVRLFGPAPLPPRYSLGLWYSRYPTFNRAGLEELIADFQKRDLPLDVLVLDLEWHQRGWNGFDWDENHIRRPREFLKNLHNDHIYTTLNLHPDKVPTEDSRYQAFIAAAGIEPKVEHRPDGSTDIGNYDLANKRHADAFMDVLHGPVQDDGVDFWWIDGHAPVDDNLVCRQFWTNEVFNRFARRTQPTRRPMIFSRSAGLGSHRYPFFFTGDTLCQFEVLKSQVEYTLRAGHIGQSMITHDIGGHMSLGHYLDVELYQRWLQWGVMSPVFRLHSSRGGERRPWKYESDALNRAFAAAVRWRMELLPYLYTLTWQTTVTGLPLCRSNPIEAPEWEAGYAIWDSYFLGDRIYCAPIVTPGGWRDLRLPPGVWVNLFTGEILPGDEPRRVTVAEEEFPVFARRGSILVKQAYALRAGVLPERLRVEIYPTGADHTDRFTLYLDDGISNQHAAGSCTIVEFVMEETAKGMTLRWTVGEGSTPDFLPRNLEICIVSDTSYTRTLPDGSRQSGEKEQAGPKKRVRQRFAVTADQPDKCASFEPSM
jgi:alpha-glucosidase (family GH31 glycosyl hydrolase)